MSKRSRRRRKHNKQNQKFQHQQEQEQKQEYKEYTTIPPKKKFKDDIDAAVPKINLNCNMKPLEITKTDGNKKARINEENVLFGRINSSISVLNNSSDKINLEKKDLGFLLEVLSILFSSAINDKKIEIDDRKVVNATLEYILEVING
jgi:hypothetical protein